MEGGPVPGAGAHTHGVIQQLRESAHDGQPESEPLAAVSLGVVQLHKLMKDCGLVL